MGMLKLDAVVHWSIPVNNLEEAEKFYGDILGLEYVGRLANSPVSCFKLGTHNILLCRRKEPLIRTIEQDGRLHHAFDVSPEMFNRACKLFRELGIQDTRGHRLSSWRFFYGPPAICPRSERQSH